jgi:TonB family protein
MSIGVFILSCAHQKPVNEGGAPYEIIQWKVKVKGLVESLWESSSKIDIKDTSLVATYLLNISYEGKLLEKKLLISSGNAAYDKTVLSTLNNITCFPPPPSGLLGGHDRIEVILSFKQPKGA